MSEQSKNAFEFCINWKVTFFSVCLFPLLITLGFWQIDRANEKQMILDLWDSRQTMPPLNFDQVPNDLASIDFDTDTPVSTDQRFRKIKFAAIFDQDKYWLLEGKTHRGQVGYHVIMPANIEYLNSVSPQWILVNRGWVKGSAYRSELPAVVTPSNKVIIEGNLAEPTDALFVSESDKHSGNWPYQILEVNIEAMSKQIGVALHSKIVQIDPESPHALTASWPKVNVLPEKHQAYAFQWFTMALALLILWLVSNTNIVERIKKPRKS